MPPFDPFTVWEIISYGWTEIGIAREECERILASSRIAPADLGAVDRIIFRDVCASFAVDAFLVFPLMLWMVMPDWGYDEVYLRRRMQAWYARPYWVHMTNPLRLLGYPVALLFAWKYRTMLRRAVARRGVV